jgi:hypothetical protein
MYDLELHGVLSRFLVNRASQAPVRYANHYMSCSIRGMITCSLLAYLWAKYPNSTQWCVITVTY